MDEFQFEETCTINIEKTPGMYVNNKMITTANEK